jgi:uncharacterized protein
MRYVDLRTFGASGAAGPPKFHNSIEFWRVPAEELTQDVSTPRRPVRARDVLGRPIPLGDPRAVEPVDETPQPPEPTLADAQRLLDAGRAFSAHEVLEARWKSCPAAEREFWQGLAQLCVGVTHAQRGNEIGAVALLRRGAGRLRRYSGPTYGVPAATLVEWAEGVADGLARSGAGDHASQVREGARGRRPDNALDLRLRGPA